MSYVFWNIFWCLLAAALLGGLVGWFLKTLFGDSATADLDASWQSRFGTLENERDRLASALRESDGQTNILRTRHSALETDFSKATTELDAISGKLMIQEESLSEWNDKARAWTGERAKLAADLEGWKRKGTDAAAKLAKLEADCGSRVTDLELKLTTAETQLAAAAKQRTELESSWTVRYSAIESDRNSFQAQLSDLSGRTAAADAATAARIADLESHLAKAISTGREDDAAYEKRIADLNGRIEAMIAHDRANDAAHEKQTAEFKAHLSKSQTEPAQAVAADRADDAAYEKRIADLNARIEGMVAHDKTNDAAAYEKQIAGFKAQLAKSQTELAKAAATDREQDAAYEHRIADLTERIEKMIAHDKANDAAYEQQISGFKAQLAKSQTELAKAAATDREQDAAYEHRIADLTERIEKMIAHDKANDAAYEQQIAGFKAQLSKSQADLAKAVAADRNDDAAAYEKRLAGLETQLTASRTELTQLKSAEGKKAITGDIERIEGIGPAYGQKLRSIGIAWVRELLDQGGDSKGRQRIAAETGIKAELILAWVNAADLLRVDGVTPDWAELLEATGVDTVKELKNRVPVNLLAKMTETNPTGARGRIAPTLPELDDVEGWIAQAKVMRTRVSH